MDMLSSTLEALANRDESLRQIAAGAGVKYDWLSKFWNRKISDPGYIRLKRVHDYLLSRQSKEAA